MLCDSAPDKHSALRRGAASPGVASCVAGHGRSPLLLGAGRRASYADITPPAQASREMSPLPLPAAVRTFERTPCRMTSRGKVSWYILLQGAAAAARRGPAMHTKEPSN
ncbi:hypothetical protein NDU88_006203 [Pleurodeles waltl]|uniref:Uncharacterized protein n=1 Tax=Pleurodeles waltl TaxID=8319 RepID=A0AAV7MYH9_PLEWA|nr:hypothetical protein NDU88_006203 [Pleurodeles waltl]